MDLAHVLSGQETEQLSDQLKTHEEKTGNQVAVLILPSLEGEPLEAYSHRVATTWKLGQKGTDNGVLLLVALKERKLRIEVGYGLEGTLTDLRSARIIRHEIVPRFKAGDIPGGVRAGTEAILKTIDGTYQAADDAPRRPAPGVERPAVCGDRHHRRFPGRSDLEPRPPPRPRVARCGPVVYGGAGLQALRGGWRRLVSQPSFSGWC